MLIAVLPTQRFDNVFWPVTSQTEKDIFGPTENYVPDLRTVVQ